MRIEVEVRSVYGKPVIYPVNQAAKDAAALVGAKTLQQRHIALLGRLGHEVVEVAQPKLCHLIGHDGEGMACYLGARP